MASLHIQLYKWADCKNVIRASRSWSERWWMSKCWCGTLTPRAWFTKNFSSCKTNNNQWLVQNKYHDQSLVMLLVLRVLRGFARAKGLSRGVSHAVNAWWRLHELGNEPAAPALAGSLASVSCDPASSSCSSSSSSSSSSCWAACPGLSIFLYL